MLDFDSANGTLMLPWWAAAVLLALFVALIMVTRQKVGRRRTYALLAQFAAFAAILILGWSFLERIGQRDRADERRAIEARMMELTSRAIALGSPLACLDAGAGSAVDGACEKSLFAGPETVAAAVTYVTAQLQLLADATDFANRGDGTYEQALVTLRRGIEIDRFGIAAHVLANRDACTPERCDAFNLLRDSGRLAANLRDRPFESFVSRNIALWPARGPALAATPPSAMAPVAIAPAAPAAPPVMAAQPSPPPVTQAAAPSPPLRSLAPGMTGSAPASALNMNFPSSVTIPSVSIMNNEPGVTGQNGIPESEARTDARANPARAPERQQRRPQAAQSPLQVAPPANADPAPRVQ